MATFLGIAWGAWLIPGAQRQISPGGPILHRTAAATIATLALFSFLFWTPLLRALGKLGDSTIIVGTLSRGDTRMGGVAVRAFADDRSFDGNKGCSGEFTEARTSAEGHFRFEYRRPQSQFPANGFCSMQIAVCYETSGQWREISGFGRSGACGGRTRVNLTCNVARPGNAVCNSSTKW